MNVFELTRALVDIESITGNEERVGDVLFAHLSEMAAQYGGHAELMPVEARRNNVLAWWGEPTVTLSTHMDTVPPFFPSREDDQHIWGRGACDTKGIIASMIFAVRDLLEAGQTNLALLFVVGEERNSAGALAAAKSPARLEIPDQWRAHREQAGARLQRRAAARTGSAAAAWRIRLIRNWASRRSKSCSTRSIQRAACGSRWTRSWARARSTSAPSRVAARPTSFADHAQAELFIRLVDSGDATLAAMKQAVERQSRNSRSSHHPGGAAGIACRDLKPRWSLSPPTFQRSANAWGQPYLIGPGSIHVAHTRSKSEFPKQQILEAVQIYKRMVQQLL